MKTFSYLIVGGGMAAAAAIEGIRSVDKRGTLGLFSEERYPPYARPPLSKGLWRDDRPEKIWRYLSPSILGVEEHLTTRIQAIDTAAKTVLDQNGETYGYQKLLLATGGTPVKLPFTGDGITYFRNWDDYLKVWRAVLDHQRFLVVGGGFIGAEMAAALTMHGRDVTMVFPEAGILNRVLPPDLANAVTANYRTRGVRVIVQETVTNVTALTNAAGFRVLTSGGGDLRVDHIIVGIGIRPHVGLGASAGIKTDDGIVIDDRGRTSVADIYAAGDIARFRVEPLGRSMRVEHEDNAVGQGRIAGINMAGGESRLEPLPFFYSDLFDMGFEAVGILDGRLSVEADWIRPYEEGVLYYLEGLKVVGILNWNVRDAVGPARSLIQEGREWPNPAQLWGRVRSGF